MFTEQQSPGTIERRPSKRSTITANAFQSSKQTCPRGHLYTPENTKLIKSTKPGRFKRVCRACKADVEARLRTRDRLMKLALRCGDIGDLDAPFTHDRISTAAIMVEAYGEQPATVTAATVLQAIQVIRDREKAERAARRPWIAEGVSRRAWYRQCRAARAAARAAVPDDSPERLTPWFAEGISRAEWYARRARAARGEPEPKRYRARAEFDPEREERRLARKLARQTARAALDATVIEPPAEITLADVDLPAIVEDLALDVAAYEAALDLAHVEQHQEREPTSNIRATDVDQVEDVDQVVAVTEAPAIVARAPIAFAPRAAPPRRFERQARRFLEWREQLEFRQRYGADDRVHAGAW